MLVVVRMGSYEQEVLARLVEWPLSVRPTGFCHLQPHNNNKLIGLGPTELPTLGALVALVVGLLVWLVLVVEAQLLVEQLLGLLVVGLAVAAGLLVVRSTYSCLALCSYQLASYPVVHPCREAFLETAGTSLQKKKGNDNKNVTTKKQGEIKKKRRKRNERINGAKKRGGGK